MITYSQNVNFYLHIRKKVVTLHRQTKKTSIMEEKTLQLLSVDEAEKRYLLR